VHRKLQGRRCNAFIVYEAYDAAGLVDGVAMLVLGSDLTAPGGEWVRVFFDAGRWSWTASTDQLPDPEDPAGELRFPATDLAATLGVAGTEITLADLVPRAGRSGRLLLGFATGAAVSIEHDGDRSHLRIIPPAASRTLNLTSARSIRLCASIRYLGFTIPSLLS
jgi:hypothetical protein